LLSHSPIWARFARDRQGAIALAVAVLLPVLIGFAGLGIEVGMWFAVQRQNQSAADAAAIAAALEYAAQTESGVATNPTAAATTAANCNLFSTSSSSSNPVCPLPSSASNTLTVSPCYLFSVGGSCNTSNPSGTTPNAVQVVLTQPLNTTFASFVTAIWGPNVNTVNVTTTATAAISSAGTACFLALDASAANAFLVDNGGTLPNRKCWAASNSSSGTALNCNGCTIAGPTNVVGGDVVSNGGQLSGSPNRTYASAIADPYAATLTHAFLTNGMPPTPCKPLTIGAQTSIDGNCVIAGDLALTGMINLSRGTYWVTDGSLKLSGTLQCPSCSPGGRGVTIIFTTMQGSTIGTLEVPSGGSLAINLNAPSTPPYAGYLLVQDTVAGVKPTPVTTIGSPSATLSGLLYFPRTNLSFIGNIQTDTSNCLVAVANSLSLTGNITFDASGCPAAGPTTVPTILSVFLAV
jgi:Flp pilus assembly protein TadG